MIRGSEARTVCRHTGISVSLKQRLSIALDAPPLAGRLVLYSSGALPPPPLIIYLFILIFFILIFFYFAIFWLHWVFVAAHGLSLQLRRAGDTLCCGVWASHCGGFSCCRARALGMRASVVAACELSSCGSWALEHRLSSCGAWAQLLPACGIFPDQGSNPCPLHWQVDS